MPRETLTKSGKEQLSKLQDIIQKSIDEEKLVVEKILNEPEEKLTTGQRISDKVAKFGGSWSFIITFSAILFIWIVFNSIASDANKLVMLQFEIFSGQTTTSRRKTPIKQKTG